MKKQMEYNYKHIEKNSNPTGNQINKNQCKKMAPFFPNKFWGELNAIFIIVKQFMIEPV